MTCVAKIAIFYISAFLITCEVQVNCQCYEYSNPKLEALDPKGLRVTLEDDGYSFFGFRGNINKPLQEDKYDINGDQYLRRGNNWVFTDNAVTLKIGDTIYYTIIVRKGVEKSIAKLKYTVTELVKNYDMSALSITKVQGRKHVCQQCLIFNEEFTETSLADLTKWKTLIQFPEEPDYPFNMYMPDKTITLEDGNLVITPILTETQRRTLYQPLDLSDRCTGKKGTPECRKDGVATQILPPVTTGKITTRHSFNFKYGRVEVRAKLPSGSWIIPEIHLESTDNVYGPNKYETGVKQITFVRGVEEEYVYICGGLIHPKLPNGAWNYGVFKIKWKETCDVDDWDKDFHNFTMVWTPDTMDFLVDGRQYGRVEPKPKDENDIIDASYWQKDAEDGMFHLALGLRVGGVTEYADGIKGKPWRNSASKAMLDFWRAKDTWYPTWKDGAMKIDYIRVYAL